MIRPMTDRPRARHGRSAIVVLTVITIVAGLLGWVGLSADAASSPHDPRGSLDLIRRTASGLEVVGWAADPDSPDPIAVFIEVNGVTRFGQMANLPRPDVAKAYPAFGGNRGYDKAITLPLGTYTICVWARNVGLGSNVTIGCRQATVSWSPAGSIDSVTALPGSFRIVGGAVDPNTSGPIQVDVYADGTKLGRLTAGAALHGGHGYDGTFPITQGTHNVCVTGINVGPGGDVQLGCRTVTLAESPVGSIDSLTQVSGGLHVLAFALDPDTSAPISARVTIDGAVVGTVVANGPLHHGHSFAATYGVRLSGTHTVCVIGVNVSYGSDRSVGCRAIVLQFDPVTGIDVLAQKSPGITISGWATDPDTAAPISVRITADGTVLGTVVANGAGSTHPGHRFSATYPLAAGKHTVCVVGVNVSSGSDSAPLCRSLTVNFDPFGRLDATGRISGSTDIQVRGWAIDPETTKPIDVRVTRDGQSVAGATADLSRPDVQQAYPAFGALHGFLVRVPADDQEHTICVVAVNVGLGADHQIGCAIVNAVHPVPPSAPQAVTAVADYGQATVTWTKPTSDGGAPWSSYVLTSSPASVTVTAGPTATSAVVTNLKSGVSYTFTVKAVNVAGTSAGGVSPAVKTPVGPPPQTTPAPISTSRYIRNITGSSPTDFAKLRGAGVADARANPSGHRYLMLLDIGGQSGHGVVLSATTRYLSNAALLANMKAYVDGYASAQRPSAPAHIAVGTNNDIDVSSTAGAIWANEIVNPLVAYARRYPGLVVSGANDIEPGFRGSYAATKAWLSGYLASTSAKFVFNGSADGCAWTVTNRACNNGWSMAGLYYLAGGAAPSRIINLPQIYNNTMSAQWKYISLTGVQSGKPRINFGGPLTEWTACSQAGSCGSLTGNYAWSRMWNDLQSQPALRVSSLPYSTDLRIDR